MSKNPSPQIHTWEDYERVYPWSITHRDEFWNAVAQTQIQWRKVGKKISDCDFKKGKVSWFSDFELNVSENCLDRHLQTGKGDQKALVWIGNEPGEERILTYRELHREVCRVTNSLEAMGVKKGDRVILYFPNVPELAFCVLACARIGAIHSVIFGGFAAHAIQSRISDCEAKWVITANGSFRGKKWIPLKEIVDEAIALGAPSVKKVVVFERHSNRPTPKQPIDLNWSEFLKLAKSDTHVAQSHSASDPLFILYTSGSTGKPKGVLHRMGGYLTYVSYTFQTAFQPKPNDVYWCTADVGWITGHSYLIYGPLSNGVTTVMYEGMPTYPDPGRFWQIVDQYQVSIFYSSPTAIRVLAAAGNEYVRTHSLKSLRVLGSVGEPINPEAWKWLHQEVGKGKLPIIDTWWQTETGGFLISPLAGISPQVPGCATLPLPGIEPELLNEEGKPIVGAGAGALVIKHSWPGQMTEVYGDPDRFRQTYLAHFPGVYETGDGAHRDEKGLYWISGRMDDVIKVSGHRLGTAEIESALITHSAVVESGAVGVPNSMTGEALHVFVVLKKTDSGSDALVHELIQVVRKEVGALATPKKIYWVPGLPKTRSGKIMRRILRKIVTGEAENLGDLNALSDPGVIQQLIQAVKANS